MRWRGAGEAFSSCRDGYHTAERKGRPLPHQFAGNRGRKPACGAREAAAQQQAWAGPAGDPDAAGSRVIRKKRKLTQSTRIWAGGVTTNRRGIGISCTRRRTEQGITVRPCSKRQKLSRRRSGSGCSPVLPHLPGSWPSRKSRMEKEIPSSGQEGNPQVITVPEFRAILVAVPSRVVGISS